MKSARIGRLGIDALRRQNNDALAIVRSNDNLGTHIYNKPVVLSNENATIGCARFSKGERTMKYI